MLKRTESGIRMCLCCAKSFKSRDCSNRICKKCTRKQTRDPAPPRVFFVSGDAENSEGSFVYSASKSFAGKARPSSSSNTDKPIKRNDVETSAVKKKKKRFRPMKADDAALDL